MKPDRSNTSLDDLLALDAVDVPAGMPARIRAHVHARTRPRKAAFAFRGLAAAAAAALLFFGVRARLMREPTQGQTAQLERPSDDFLMSLPALEHLEFLIDDLDPLAADAMFLLDEEDRLLLEIMAEDA